MRLVERLIYLGPNRRLERPALELHLSYSDQDLAAVQRACGGLGPRLDAMLAAHGLGPVTETAMAGVPETPERRFCALLNDLMGHLLAATGHQADYRAVLDEAGSGEFRCVVECEDSITGERVSDLALSILAGLTPELEWEAGDHAEAGSPGQQIREFLSWAPSRALPADSAAVIAAAHAMDIPVIRLDREPYEGVTGDFRVRPNGLLLLGQCRWQQLLDGTLYVNRSADALPLAHQPRLRRQFLARLGVPMAGRGQDEKPGHVLVVVNGELLCALQPADGHPGGWAVETTPVHPVLQRMALRLAQAAGVAVLRIDLEGHDLTAAPGTPGGVLGVSDFDPAPRLDQLLAGQPELLTRAAEGLIRWAFPEHSSPRIPTVVVTGTNGKSTTSAMIARILQHDGRRVGLAHTEGVIIDGQLLEGGDLAGFRGHYRIFESAEVDVGVLETARGGVVKFGFAFEWCDVSVCLNVDADHLGLQGVHTVEQMAAVKQSIVARARGGAVLNADDPWCAAMADDVPAQRLCMVSLQDGLPALRERFPRADAWCGLERSGDTEALVLAAGSDVVLEIPVGDLPAAFGGAARFNIENAMHAVAAAHFLGVSPSAMRAGITSFEPGFEALPGRLNFQDVGSFRVLMDYAHNEHGLRRLLDFLNTLEVAGRRMLVFGVSGDRLDEQAAHIMGLLAHEFDHYILKDFIDTRGREPLEMPRLCGGYLQQRGVPEQAITLIEDEREACRFGLQTARPGDLVVMLLGHSNFRPVWSMIQDWRRAPESAS